MEYHLPFLVQDDNAVAPVLLTGTARLKVEGPNVTMHPVFGDVFPPFVVPRWGLVRLRKLPDMGQSGRVFLLYLEERYHGEVHRDGGLPLIEETPRATCEPIPPDRFEPLERRQEWLNWILQTYGLKQEPKKVSIKSEQSEAPEGQSH